jgi:hypothetical protein
MAPLMDWKEDLKPSNPSPIRSRRTYNQQLHQSTLDPSSKQLIEIAEKCQDAAKHVQIQLEYLVKTNNKGIIRPLCPEATK